MIGFTNDVSTFQFYEGVPTVWKFKRLETRRKIEISTSKCQFYEGLPTVWIFSFAETLGKRLRDPRPENAEIGIPGTHFVDFWTQRQKMLKSDFLGPILSTSGPNARKCKNRTSWDPFCRLLDPRPENAKIAVPGTHFVDFWNQGQKMLKSDFLGPNTHQRHA